MLVDPPVVVTMIPDLVLLPTVLDPVVATVLDPTVVAAFGSSCGYGFWI